MTVNIMSLVSNDLHVIDRECDIISSVLCKAGGMRHEVDSRDEVMHSEMSD